MERWWVIFVGLRALRFPVGDSEGGGLCCARLGDLAPKPGWAGLGGCDGGGGLP